MNILITPTQTGGGSLPAEVPADQRPLALNDRAARAFSDFRARHPVTVDENSTIDEALAAMIQHGVRAVLAMHDNRITGLITSYDIQGETPLQFLQKSTYTRHEDIRVADIMTPWGQLSTIDYSAIAFLDVEDLLALFRSEAAPSHLLVVEAEAASPTVVRGIISRFWIERQLQTASNSY